MLIFPPEEQDEDRNGKQRQTSSLGHASREEEEYGQQDIPFASVVLCYEKTEAEQDEQVYHEIREGGQGKGHVLPGREIEQEDRDGNKEEEGQLKPKEFSQEDQCDAGE